MFTNFTILFLEPNNEYSINAIIVKSNNVVYMDMFQKHWQKSLFPLMKEWKLYKVTATITVEKRRVPDGTWVLGGGIELPCTYYLYGPKIHKCNVKISLKK